MSKKTFNYFYDLLLDDVKEEIEESAKRLGISAEEIFNCNYTDKDIIDPLIPENKLSFVDLCCGSGGFHTAIDNIKEVNSKCLLASDIDKDCRKVFFLNHGLPVYNDLSKIEYKDKKIDIICAGFPCFVKDTKVLTNNGYKNIQEVETTDKLLTHTGKFQNIINFQKKIYNKNLYKIRVNYSPYDLKTTEEHPFYIYRNGNIQWINANELTESDYVGMPINTKNEILRKTDFFMLGCYMGNNINNNKIPDFVHNSPASSIKLFIQGYESINKDMVNMSLKLSFDIQRLLLKIGKIGEIIYQNNFYKIKYHNKNNKNMGFIKDNYFWRKIKSIETEKTNEMVYNFEVENDNSYCVENIIVHNCQPFSVAGKRLGLDDARGTVIHNILKLLEDSKAKLIVLENVKGLKSMKNTDKNNEEVMAYNLIKTTFEQLGYYFYDRVISPHEINIPQKRERVVMIGIRKDLVDGEYETNEDFVNERLEYVEKLIVERREKNKDKKIFQEDSEIKPEYKLSKKQKNTLNVWRNFVSMEDWDNINNDELGVVYMKHYLKRSQDKIDNVKKHRNYKQLHFFTDFLHYKNSMDIPDCLEYKNRRSKKISNSVKKQCDILNCLYEHHTGFKDLVDKFLTTNKDSIQKMSYQNRYLEYSGGKDYGIDCNLDDFYGQYRMSGLRVRRSDYFPTLVKSGPLPVIIKKERFVTDVECGRLQSFKEGFVFISKTTAMRRTGNAVNTEVIELMIRSAIDCMNLENYKK
jgi:DNA (cytosine-5)-methyltransferase 1